MALAGLFRGLELFKFSTPRWRLNFTNYMHCCKLEGLGLLHLSPFAKDTGARGRRGQCPHALKEREQGGQKYPSFAAQ